MGRLTHSSNLPISLAVWLSYDEYDYVDQKNYISATSLLKPTRQAVLAARVRKHPIFGKQKIDVMQFFASRLGTAIHNSIDKTWDDKPRELLKMLGYPEKTVEDLVIFTEKTGLPEADELQSLRDQGKIIVAKEVRMFRKFGKYVIGGKIDFVFDGKPEDFKTVKTWAYGDKNKAEKELMQISLYRWLNPALITSDIGCISQIFLDWMKSMSKQRSNYPPEPIISTDYELHSEVKVEQFIQSRIDELEKFIHTDEKELPRCTKMDLWQAENSYKYYSDPAKANDPKARSTKNFTSYFEAEQFRQEKGKGAIKMIEGKVKACNYCAGFEMCTQKDEYLNSGLLTVED